MVASGTIFPLGLAQFMLSKQGFSDMLIEIVCLLQIFFFDVQFLEYMQREL